MSDHQDITFNVTGQTIYLDVPEGQPSSVTSVKVLRWDENDDAASEWSVSASIDTVSTTFDANSGVSSTNPRVLNLASTTGINAGQQYLATDAQGRKEWPRITGIVSAASCTAVLGLGLDYVSGDTLVGTRISATVDPTWIADATNINPGNSTFDYWRVRWQYVANSLTYVRTTTFNVSRKAGQHGVRANDISLRFPSLVNMFPSGFRKERMQILIDRAYDEWATDLIGIDIPDELVLSPKIVNEMVSLKTAVLVNQDRAMAGGETAGMEIAERIYSQRFQSIFAAPAVAKVPVATDNTGAGDVRKPLRLSSR